MIKVLKRLGNYMGRRKALLPLSVALSAINGLLSLVPFVLVWLVVRSLLTTGGNLAATPVWNYALAAFAVSVFNVLLYFLALALSHLAAFRVETNMRRQAMHALMRAPLGFFDTHNTGGRLSMKTRAKRTHSWPTYCPMWRAASSRRWALSRCCSP